MFFNKEVRPLLLLIENTLYQNFSSVYPFLIKTRRSTSLKKMYQSPVIFNNMCVTLIDSLEFLNSLKHISIIQLLRHFYLDLNIWYFFKYLCFSNQGHYLSNLNLSYTYWTLKSNTSQLNLRTVNTWPRLTLLKNTNFLLNTRLVALNLKRLKFNKITFLVLFILLQPFINVTKNINITYAFILIQRNFNFLIFYSSFYFKIHNF